MTNKVTTVENNILAIESISLGLKLSIESLDKKTKLSVELDNFETKALLKCIIDML